MSQTPGTGPSREDRPPSEYAFSSRSAVSPYGAVIQETVLNPEGRRLAGRDSSAGEFESDLSVSPSLPDSQVSKRLFPGESDAAASADLEAPSGCELGHFSIEDRIGSGGMGAVFRALDTRLQRVVALKVLSPSQSRDRAAVLRFQNEARAAARLDHENVARVFYVGEDRGLHFIAFEYVTGQNVRELIARTGRLPVADVVNYALQVAAALRHTSAAGVVHRDIKPSNIIIAPNGRAKLVDLGLARKLAADSVGDLTVAGTTLGTFDYISPEQARDPRNVDVRSDIYSLGCTIYHMLTGGPPYSSGTVLQKLLDHQSGQAPDPRSVNAQVPAALSAVCRKMMAGDPRNRYATPDDLIRDLATVAAGLGLRPLPAEGYVWARPPAPASPRLRSGLIWAGSAAVVLLLAFLVDRWPTTVDPEPLARASESRIDGSEDRPVLSSGIAAAGDDSGRTAEPPIGNSEPLIGEAMPRDAASRVRPDDLADLDDQGLLRTGSVVGQAVGPASPLRADRPGADENGLVVTDSRSAGDSTAEAVTYSEFADQISRLGSAFQPFFDLWRPEVEPEPETSRAPVTTGDIDPPPFEPTAPFVLKSPASEWSVYRSLADAVAGAYSGDTIELHFDGRLAGAALTEPIKIDDKSVAVVAGIGPDGRPYRPLIEFAGNVRSASQPQMVTVSGEGGGLRLEGVELRMTVTGEAGNASKQWALFGLSDTEQVWMNGVGVTVVNPEGRPVSIFDLRPPEGVSPLEYEIMGMRDEDRSEGFLVELGSCFVRGGADLVTIAHALPGRIVIRDTAVAIDADLLDVTGGFEKPPAGDEVEVELEYVTAVVGGAILQLDVGRLPRHAATIHVMARNNVFATTSPGPFVLMAGNAGLSTFEQALVWDGSRSVFEGSSEFWSIYTADGAAETAPTTFERWKRHWGGDFSADAEQAVLPDGLLDLWADARDAKSKTRSEIVAADLTLDPDGVPVDWIEADDGLIGAPTDRLPQISNAPSDLDAGDRSAAAR